jgi:ABC-2 type transport system permease protein
MMLRGLLRLTWLEIKIFLREPLGAFGTLFIPVLVYLFLGRLFGRGRPVPTAIPLMHTLLPTFAAILIMINTVLSLVTIIAIYREGGILKRLRATPLRPWTILTAHVLAKLLFTAATLIMMMLAGRRYYPADLHIPVISFTLALLFATWSTLAIGFVLASVVRNARFAQPAAGVILYPMLGLSGLFFPISALPPGLQIVARFVPLTYVVSLLTGILKGDPWSAHATDVAALALVFALCIFISARVFRWE